MANSRIYLKSEAGGTTTLSRDTSSNSGNLVLPASGNVASVDTAVTDNAIARFDSTTGKLQNSGVVIDDNNDIKIPAKMYVGTVNTQTPTVSAQFNGITPSIASGEGHIVISSTDAATVDKGGVISFAGNTTSLNGYSLASIAGKYQTAGAGNYGGYLQFLTTSQVGTITERMRIDSAGNVGIGTSSPVNSKFNRTFTTQVTGSASVAITAGDYSSGAASTVTAIESLGARGDGNGTFGGRFGASYRRTIGEVIPAGNTIGYYAFGGQWGTDVGYTPSKHLYPASICGVAEGAFTSATAMPTGISFRTGSTGESLSAVNTTYGIERMRIDANGNVLVTSSGGLGYGTGSGGTVTQLTSKSTAVTLNKPSGQIIMNNAALAAGATVLFTLTLPISTSDILLVNIPVSSPSSNAYEVSSRTGNNGAYIILKNISTITLAEAVVINFSVIKGANA